MSRKLRFAVAVVAILLFGPSSAFAQCEYWTCWRTSPDRGECKLSFRVGHWAASCTAVYDCPPWNPEGPCGVWCEYNHCYEV